MQLAALLMLILTLVSWGLARNWLAPGVMLCGSFALVYLAQSLFASDMNSSAAATMVIFGLCTFFVAGECLGRQLSKFRAIPPPPPARPSTRSQKKLAWLIIFIGLLALYGTYRYMAAVGLFDAGDLISALLKIAIIREQIMLEGIQVPMIDRIGFLFAYSGVILSIVYWYYFGWRWWLVLSPLAVILAGIAQAGRAGTMVMLLQWALAVLFKTRMTRNWALLHKALWLLFGVVVVFILGQLFREGFDEQVGSQSIGRTLETSRGYLFGGISAFAYYIDRLFDFGYMAYGKYSFSSLFAALGWAKQEIGIYDTYAPISSIGETTNVYTAFRSFIDDFTLPGAGLFYFGAGVTTSYLNEHFVAGRTVLITILVPLYSWLVFSPMASLTYFNSFLLSLIAPYLFLRWIGFLPPMQKE